MFPIMHGILGQRKRSAGVCSYPLDKTDFSDIEAIFGDTIFPVEFSDSSKQEFKVPGGNTPSTCMAAPEGFGVNMETYTTEFPDRGVVPRYATYACKLKHTDSINMNHYPTMLFVDFGDVGFIEQIPYQIRHVPEQGLVIEDNFGNYSFELPNEFTLVTVIDNSNDENPVWYTYIPEISEFVIQSGSTTYTDNFNRKFGFAFTGAYDVEDVYHELITDHETLSNLLSGVEFPDDIPADFKPATLCGQPLDLTPSSGG